MANLAKVEKRTPAGSAGRLVSVEMPSELCCYSNSTLRKPRFCKQTACPMLTPGPKVKSEFPFLHGQASLFGAEHGGVWPRGAVALEGARGSRRHTAGDALAAGTRKRAAPCNAWAWEMRVRANLWAYFFSCGIQYRQFKLSVILAQYRASEPFCACAGNFFLNPETFESWDFFKSRIVL